jgi:hypothetical protein
MSNVMDMIIVLNEFFEEYLSFSMLWQPDTSQWLKPFRSKVRIFINVGLRLRDLLDWTNPEGDFI